MAAERFNLPAAVLRLVVNYIVFTISVALLRIINVL